MSDEDEPDLVFFGTPLEPYDEGCFTITIISIFTNSIIYFQMLFQKENLFLLKIKLLQIPTDDVGFMGRLLEVFLRGFSILLVHWKDGNQVNSRVLDLKKHLSRYKNLKISWMMKILANMVLHLKLLRLLRNIQQSRRDQEKYVQVSDVFPYLIKCLLYQARLCLLTLHKSLIATNILLF